MTEAIRPAPKSQRFLDAVERLGNALPDPVFIFIGIIFALIAVSVIGASAGWAAVNPVTGEALQVKSLLSEENLQKLLVEAPRTYTGFAPLGMVLTIMLGAGLAEKTGLFAALMRASLTNLPAAVLTPAVFVIGMLTTHAADAGFVVYVPLAALAFVAAGRHPVLGLVTAFSGTAVGLSGNLLPGQYDVLILGITETGARLIDPTWTMNPLGNWFFGIGIAMVFTTLGWLVIEKVVAPRLGVWTAPADHHVLDSAELRPDERKGLRAAGLVALVVSATFAALALWPGFTPLYDEVAAGSQRMTPLFRSLPAFLMVMLLLSGWAYGACVGVVRSHRDVVRLMVQGLEPFVPYMVLIFFAAHFVAMFGWSNLGSITAITGAEAMRALGAPPAVLLPMLATLSAWLDFLIASGSAKWSAMAPVAAPMGMLLGISPEMTTAAYRVGDTVTNLISPLNPYLILALGYCQRWIPSFRLGSLLALLLPIAAAFYLGGVILTAAWVGFDIPVGPGAITTYAR